MSISLPRMLSIVSLLLQSIAEAYAAEGATVVLTARSEDQLEEASPLEMHQCITCMRACHVLLHQCWSLLVRAAACAVGNVPRNEQCLWLPADCKELQGKGRCWCRSAFCGKWCTDAHDRLLRGK